MSEKFDASQVLEKFDGNAVKMLKKLTILRVWAILRV